MRKGEDDPRISPREEHGPSALLFVIFTVAVLVATAAAVTGRRGQVCVRGVGYTVPAAVEADPVLDKRANELVARWCTVAAVLWTVPLLGLAVHDLDRDLPLRVVVALGVYGSAVVCLATYPFEKIKQLGDADRRAP